MKKLEKPEIKMTVNDDLAEGIYMASGYFEVTGPFYVTQGLGNEQDHNHANGCRYGTTWNDSLGKGIGIDWVGGPDGHTYGTEPAIKFQGDLTYHGPNLTNTIIRIDIFMQNPAEGKITGEYDGSFGQLHLVPGSLTAVGDRLITYWQGNIQNGEKMGFNEFYVYFKDWQPYPSNYQPDTGWVNCYNTTSTDPTVVINAPLPGGE